MEKHIRIYSRKKYNIKKSDFVDILYMGTYRGMSIYILLLQYNKKYLQLKKVNYSWNNYCVMYDKSKGIRLFIVGYCLKIKNF